MLIVLVFVGSDAEATVIVAFPVAVALKVALDDVTPDNVPAPERLKVAPLFSLSFESVTEGVNDCPTSRVCVPVGEVRVTTIAFDPPLHPAKKARVANKQQRASFFIDFLKSNC